MKLAIFGATGRTGTELIKQAIVQGHRVTAFVRDPARLNMEHERLATLTGDVFDPAGVSRAIQGQDAVICALGAGSDLKRTTVRTTGTINIINGMKKNDVNRLIVITAMGVGESWKSLSLVNKIIFATLLRSSREDHESQEIAVKQSGVAWTIIRPSALNDSPLTTTYEIGENIWANTSKIARADVAHAILKELREDTFLRRSITITN